MERNNQKPWPHLEEEGISAKVCEAIRKIPRDKFVRDSLKHEAFGDYPLSIECNQTISQPSLVAEMTDLLELKEDDKVLEIGTGSGFQTVLLAQLVKEVHTIEYFPNLETNARILFFKLGYHNIKTKIGDGKKGWWEKDLEEPEAPFPFLFDKIIITASANELPQELIKQLKVNGIMILPLKEVLYKVVKIDEDGTVEKYPQMGVRFVPLL